nr:uncharacterized protein LOC105723876 [Aotus nancymaae]
MGHGDRRGFCTSFRRSHPWGGDAASPKDFCSPLTPPENPCLQPSGLLDSRLLLNHGEQPWRCRSQLDPRSLVKEMRFSTRDRPQLPSSGICKMATSSEIVGRGMARPRDQGLRVNAFGHKIDTFGFSLIFSNTKNEIIKRCKST